MNINPELTVLIPTYNRVELLKRSVANVLRQTYFDFIIIIIDNNSNDGTGEYVKKLLHKDQRIKYIKHSQNIGGLANFKYAFSLVDTKYFCILSDDDFYTKDFIRDGVNVLNSYTNIDFVIQNTLWINKEVELISDGGFNANGNLKFYCDEYRFDAFVNYTVPYLWTGMIFRGKLAKLYLDRDNNNDIGSDFRYLFRIISKHNYAHLAKIGAFFTSHSSSMSSNRPYFDSIEYFKECERYIEILEDNSVDELLKNRVRFYFFRLFNSHPYKKGLKEASRHLLKNWCNSPDLPKNSIIKFADDFRSNGFVKTAIFFSKIYEFQSLKFIFSIIFGIYNNYKLKKSRRDLFILRQTKYKSLFDEISSV